MVPLKAAALAVLLAAPAAALVAPAALEALRPPPGAGDNGPPLYSPPGYGLFPAEGALGTHGCPAPVAVADVLAGRLAPGAEVCLETSVVVRADPRNRSRAFTVEAPSGERLEAHISQRWWTHGTPAEGMLVVVEGTVARGAGGAWRLDPVARWVDLTHPGEEVELWEVAEGLVPEGTYVWLRQATVGMVWRNNDGPGGVGDDHVEVATACPPAKLTTETTPPYFGIVQAPPIGATVRLYGAARWDDGWQWWEVHPIRAWEALPSQDAAAGCPGASPAPGAPVLG